MVTSFYKLIMCYKKSLWAIKMWGSLQSIAIKAGLVVNKKTAESTDLRFFYFRGQAFNFRPTSSGYFIFRHGRCCRPQGFFFLY